MESFRASPSNMMEVVADRDVWQLNIELLLKIVRKIIVMEEQERIYNSF